jgi:hypothetical protein
VTIARDGVVVEGLNAVIRPRTSAEWAGHQARRPQTREAGHGRSGRPGEVVVQHCPDRVVLGQCDVRHRLIEAGDRSPIHLLVRSVAAVDPHHRGLIAIDIGVGRRATECLGPVGGEALAVLGVETMAKRVADHLVCHHPGVPRHGKAEQALVATRGLVHSLHVPRMAAGKSIALVPMSGRPSTAHGGSHVSQQVTTMQVRISDRASVVVVA